MDFGQKNGEIYLKQKKEITIVLNELKKNPLLPLAKNVYDKYLTLLNEKENFELLTGKTLKKKDVVDLNLFFMMLSQLDLDQKKGGKIKIILIILYFFPIKIGEVRTMTNIQIIELFEKRQIILKKGKYFKVPEKLEVYLDLIASNYQNIERTNDPFFKSQKGNCYHEKAFLILVNKYLFQMSISWHLKKILKTSDFYQKGETNF